MNKKVKIYTLSDPITNEVRYVGKTVQTFKKRLERHLSDSKKDTTHKSNWIKSLIKKGLSPNMEMIDEISEEAWEFWEKYWISQFKTWGFRLTNLAEGGEGVKGIVPWNKETKGLTKANSGSFKKGCNGNKKGTKRLTVWNKGTKGIMKPNETSFKKGEHRSVNTEIKKGERIGIKTEFKKGQIAHNATTVLQYSLSGEFIKEFRSMKEAYLSVKGSQQCLSIKIKNNKPYNGYIWKIK